MNWMVTLFSTKSTELVLISLSSNGGANWKDPHPPYKDTAAPVDDWNVISPQLPAV